MSIKGFILAAGFGTRMRPITEELPKSLVPVCTVPAIRFALELLKSADITDIFINTHYLGAAIEHELGDGSDYGVNITYSHEQDILGTGGALRKVLPKISDDTLVVVNADTLISCNLREAIDFHYEHKSIATMVLRNDPKQASYGLIGIDGQGRIQQFLGENGPEAAMAGPLKKYMFTGIHILESRFIEYIPPEISVCINRYAYPKAMRNNDPIYGYVTNSPWRDLGQPEFYFQTNMELLNRNLSFEHFDPLSTFAHTPEKAVDSVVRLGSGVVMGEGVLLNQPVLIADDSKIGDNCRLGPNVIIGHNVTIGHDSKLIDCIILDNAKIPPQSNIQQAIICKNNTIDLAALHKAAEKTTKGAESEISSS